MARQGLSLEDLTPAVVEGFCAACRAAGYHHYTSIRGVKPLFGWAMGLVSEEPVALSVVDALLDGSRSGSSASGTSRR